MSKRKLVTIGLAVLVVLAAIGVGAYKYREVQWRNYHADVAAEQVREFELMKQEASVWAGANRQAMIPSPESLKHLPPSYTGWLNISKLALTKDGVVVLSPDVVLEPQASSTRSLLVSRLYDVGLYTVFAFRVCNTPDIELVPADSNAQGVTLVLQKFDASVGCPKQPWL